MVLEHRRRRLLDLQEQRILLVASLEQDDERPRADAADAHDLAGHVDDLEPLQQVAPIVLQRGPVGAELLVDRVLRARRRHAVGRVQVAGRDDDRRLADDPVLCRRPARRASTAPAGCRGCGPSAAVVCRRSSRPASPPSSAPCPSRCAARAWIAAISSSSDRWAYQMSIVPHLRELGHRLPVGAAPRRASRRACRPWLKPLLRAAIVKLAAMRFTSYSNGPGSVSSKSFRSNSSVRSGEANTPKFDR